VASDPARLDVLTMGRVGVDIYPLQAGVALEDVTTFGKYLGGSATNAAVAAARLGRSAAVITRTGNDPFGRFVHHALKQYGVGDQFVTGVPVLPTPVTFCEIFPPDDFPIYFYRYPKAPDLEIRPEELDYDAIRAARVFWVTATGLSAEPSRSATLAALEARARAGVTVLDLDYRPMFWRRTVSRAARRMGHRRGDQVRQRGGCPRRVPAGLLRRDAYRRRGGRAARRDRRCSVTASRRSSRPGCTGRNWWPRRPPPGGGPRPWSARTAGW
jgi:hypothetical protein